MKVSDHTSHYAIDAEKFDYFQERSGADRDAAKRIQDAVLASAQLKAADRVLDMGSGNGWLLERQMPDARSFTVSMDLGIVNLRTLKKRFGSEINAVVADAQHLPFRGDAFTCVIASEVLEHLNSPAEAVREAGRVLQQGGRCIATTPYREVLRYYLCVHCNQPTPANAHLHSMDETMLEAMYADAGMSQISYFTFQNKLFQYLRLSPLFRFLPWKFWRVIDRLFTLLHGKCHTILIAGIR